MPLTERLHYTDAALDIARSARVKGPSWLLTRFEIEFIGSPLTFRGQADLLLINWLVLGRFRLYWICTRPAFMESDNLSPMATVHTEIGYATRSLTRGPTRVPEASSVSVAHAF